MQKVLPTLLALLVFTFSYSQKNRSDIKGITVRGIKGVKKSVGTIIINSEKHQVPANYRIKLRPELEGPIPKGQNPEAKPLNKFGTKINGKDHLNSLNVINPKTSATSAATQSVYSNFLSIWGSYASVSGRESPYTPPDNCGDVGTTQVVATANCRMKVFNKPSVIGSPATTPTGSSTTTLSEVANIDLNVFFTNSSLGINSISDPHVRFDRLSGRWFIVAIDVNHTSGSNYCCVAVSSGPTITSGSSFSIFYFSVAGTGGSSADFFDYPTLGIDKNSLLIGGNMFAYGSSFSGSNMWVINKASLIGGTLNLTSFPHNLTGTDMYTPQGVQNDDPGSLSGYFIGASQTLYSKLVIRRVSYSSSAPTLSGDLNLTTTTTYTPNTVPTLGGVAIDGNDRRLCAAMIKKNKISGVADLYVAQGTLLNNSGIGGSGGDRDGALWLEITNLSSTPTIAQSATLYDATSSGSSAINYTYPTIALSGQGHNLMGFTSAGASKYAQAAAAGRYRTDPAGNFQAPVDLTATTSSYNPGANRWGDYTQTVVDPSDDMTMWTFTQYAPTTNAWGVRAAQFIAPPPATPVLAATPACGTTTNVTINGTSTNNSEFFDPGPDAGGPGFNHLNLSVSGPSPVTVSNIVFVNPTQITANFQVPASAVAGTYTLTVTNPDQQSATTTFNLSCTAPACVDPTNLNASNITNTGATLNWTAVTDATGYNVDYVVSGSGSTPTQVTPTPTTNTTTLSLLQPGTTYTWRVQTKCAAGVGNYISSQFTTTAPPCDPPTGLTSTVTATSATVNWSAPATGASNYTVQYSKSGANVWTVLPPNTATSASISGLSPSTPYDWKVKSNCSGSSSVDATANFTTASAPCDPPTNLTPSAIMATSASLNWSAPATGASDYTVQYSKSGANAWTVLPPNAATSASITGLSPSTPYDWKVKSNCSGTSSVDAMSNFTTASCSDSYEPNNTLSTAARIPVGTNIIAQIATPTDKDYYSFTNNSSQSRIKITLNNLPADYDLRLYRNSTLVAVSANGGTTPESIIYNTTRIGTYTAYVYGYNGAFSNTQCYTLKVQLGSSNFTAANAIVLNDVINQEQVTGLSIFPTPASNVVTLTFDGYAKRATDLIICNQVGQEIKRKNILVVDGFNNFKVDMSELSSGLYFVKLFNGKEMLVQKMLINK